MERCITGTVLIGQFRGKEITAEWEPLERGCLVTLFGGDQTHIGSTTMICSEGEPQTICFPGHKERQVTEQWASALYEILHEPVCVTAGIHYDHLTPEGIREVLAVTDRLLDRLIQYLAE